MKPMWMAFCGFSVARACVLCVRAHLCHVYVVVHTTSMSIASGSIKAPSNMVVSTMLQRLVMSLLVLSQYRLSTSAA